MDFAIFEKIANNNCSEEGVSARFYDRAVKTKGLKTNGLPIFEMVCFCEIRIMDNNSEIYDQPATEEKIRRFPIEYARYQLAKKQAVEGTPLEQFSFLTRAEIETLKVHGILTVEALAQLEEPKAEQLDIVQEKSAAVHFLEQAKGNLELINQVKKENQYIEKIKQLEKEIIKLKYSQKFFGKKRKQSRYLKPDNKNHPKTGEKYEKHFANM